MTLHPITKNHFPMDSQFLGKTAQFLEDNTENVTSSSELPTNHKTKVHKFIYIKVQICLSKDPMGGVWVWGCVCV